ncbi:MAG: ribosome assembly cofactor RimP [Bacteroidales bacterium]|jgi:ribosome maturation factor RimP|nr:ribosome assembly cofactor RimP [Bacteroidales bacterium]
MISKDFITQIVENNLDTKAHYIVDIKIDSSNRINVLVDGIEGFTINECVKISRAIEGSLDREKEDFELQVSTPGLDMPFKVNQQYEKNLNKEVEVKLSDGNKIVGKMTEVTDNTITVEYKKKEKVEGHKKKQTIEYKDVFNKEEVETRLVISFK